MPVTNVAVDGLVDTLPAWSTVQMPTVYVVP